MLATGITLLLAVLAAFALGAACASLVSRRRLERARAEAAALRTVTAVLRERLEGTSRTEQRVGVAFHTLAAGALAEQGRAVMELASRSADEIRALGRELYDRLRVFARVSRPASACAA
jgi:hypothetical protein